MPGCLTLANVDEGAEASLKVIPPEECIALLRSVGIGRLAIARVDRAPLVVTVNYVVEEDAVVLRTDAGAKLSLLRRRPVSFQVDLLDPVHRSGWSVLVEGFAEVVTGPRDSHLEPAGARSQAVLDPHRSRVGDRTMHPARAGRDRRSRLHVMARSAAVHDRW